MATLAEIKRMLLSLAVQLRTSLDLDPRCSGLLPAPRQYRRAQDDYTNGYWLAIGSLGRGIFVELWLDHYAGLSSPRFWCGVRSTSYQRLSRLLTYPPLAVLRKKLLKRSGRDVTRRPPYQFVHPLRSGEFDILVQEYYSGDRHYLGVYSNYPWPFSPHHRKAIVRDATNLVAELCAAFARTAGTGRAIRTPGPWARPNRQTEQAAVRHVRRHLRKAGYRVKSRESEICGYDLHVTRNNQELHVEVKGCSDVVPRFFISRTELKTASSDPNWRLVVITNARERPCAPRFLTGKEMKKLFTLEPTGWEGRPAIRAGS